MPKQIRKRKHEINKNHVDYEDVPPLHKFKLNEKDQAEEEQLSKILFGGSTSFLESLEEAEMETTPINISLSPDSGVGDDSDSDIRKPAWVDEDDDIKVGQALNTQGRKLPKGGINDRQKQYSNLLKHKFENALGKPRWAALKRDTDCLSDSDDEVLQTCGFLRNSKKNTLPPRTLEFKKVKDLNNQTYMEGIINCIEFHPKSTVALVAGNSGVSSLFAVDGKSNNKLHSVAFQKFPILCARFTYSGDEAVFGSRHSHIFSYDLMTAKAIKVPLPHGLTQCKNFIVSPDSKYLAVAGKWGEVHLLSGKTKERINLLKQDSDVTALAFNPSGDTLYGHSSSGEITMWDICMGRVKHKWIDEGCLEGSTIDVSSSNQYIAAGSTQGIVNLYNVNDVLQTKYPKPKKAIYNLRTGINCLKFNASSEMLAFSSSDIEDSVRLLHMGSTTVFNNFPPFSAKLRNVTALNISPGSGFIAFGNKKSTVSLYRLKYYDNY